MKKPRNHSDSDPLPLVTQIGFAGARALFLPGEHPGVDPAAFADAVAEELSALLRELPGELGLPPSGFLCGISALAVGGDTAFSRACQTLAIPQRLFLPQHFDAFLAAIGSKGPDFDPDQLAAAEALRASGHIIETRVVSDAHERRERFHDTNLEIARVSDVLICLVRAGQAGKAGGTLELVELAARLGKPALVVAVAVGGDGLPVLTREWREQGSFVKPALPAELSGNVQPFVGGGAIPEGTEYCQHLKNLGSGTANRLRGRFKQAAWIIVGGHVLATALALVALHSYADWVRALLGLEIGLLALGLLTHHHLHRDHSIGRWATFRLLAEVARSVIAIGKVHVYLDHFFKLPFPAALRPLLRTVNVLHLRDTAAAGGEAWQEQRDAYVENRLRKRNAQVDYNARTRANAHRWLKRAHVVFYAFSIGALFATLLKLLALFHYLPLEAGGAAELAAKAWLGSFAVLFPVVAVAALSLAAAFDQAAKAHTSEEMLEFLARQERLLTSTTSPREFARLVIETETRLLGETANWYARRSFVGVA